MRKQSEENQSTHSEKTSLSKDFFKQFKNKEEFHSFFNDLFKQGIEEMLQAELDEHLGYEKYARDGTNSGNSRNGSYPKTVMTGKAVRECLLCGLDGWHYAQDQALG